MQLPVAKVVLVDCREELKKYNIDINDYMKTAVAPDAAAATFPCRDCSLIFRTKRYRMIHETRFHSKNSTKLHHECPKCPKRFYTTQDRDDHFYIRHSNQKYQCELCPFTCRLRCRMELHLAAKHRTSTSKPYVCQFCDKRFFIPQMLRSHIVRQHKSESEAAKLSPYTCRLCRHKIKRKDITDHMQRHNEITDSKCKMCELRFLTSDDLVVHTKSHESDVAEQITCCFCDFQSPNSLTMDRHIEEVHIDPKKTFACGECGKEFQSKGNLKYHENVAHRAEVNAEMVFDDIFKGTTLDSDEEDDKPGKANSKMSDESMEALQKQINSISVNEDGNPAMAGDFMMNGDDEEDTPVIISIDEAEKLLANPEKLTSPDATTNPPENLIEHIKEEVEEDVEEEEEEDKQLKDDEQEKQPDVNKSRRIVPLEELTCPFCNIRFARRREINSHKARHREETDHRCSQCPLRFLARTKLDEHVNDKHKHSPLAKMYKCSLCSYTTKSRFYMKSHNKRAHHKKAATPTPILAECNDSNGSVEESVKKKKKQQQDKFKCEICGKVLKTAYTLKNHWNMHKNPHKCNICGKAFSVEQRLENHVAKHDSSKDIFCNFCPMSFLTAAEMELHLGLEHEQANMKIVTCPHCPYRTSFTRALNMRSHIRNVHKLAHSSTIVRDLKMELLDAEEKKLYCLQCKRRMPTEEALVQHMKTHEIGVDEARKERNRSKNRKKREERQAQGQNAVKPTKEPKVAQQNGTTTEVATSTQPMSILECFFECDICEIFLESVSTMREHFVMQHNNLKPYKCEICDNRFPTWPILRRHQRLSHKALPTFIPDRIIIQQQQRKRRRSPSTSSTSSTSSGSSSSTGSSSTSSTSSGSSGNRSKASSQSVDTDVSAALDRVAPRSDATPAPKKKVSLKVMTLTNKISDNEYQCDICRQTFDAEDAFKSHFQYHDNVNPYKCELCSKRFEAWTSMKRHQSIVHKGYRNNCI
uniref:C2H2-type domain-containing protein n=2 Tax=Lutzomyia longipalpis TaxID=7200 RepID=A0A1B0GL47_LUTLO